MSSMMIRSGALREWLPADPEALDRWREHLLATAESRGPAAVLHPVISAFHALIDRDPVVRMYMTEMIDQIPERYRAHHPRNIEELLRQLNAVLTIAPDYHHADFVGTPFSAVFIRTMITPAGYAAYRMPALNEMLKRVLAVWTSFLDSEASRYVINASPRGWQCEAAMKQLGMQDYRYDPGAPFWGFSSWNAFFAREVKKSARPVDGPRDPKVIVAACDSRVYRISRGVCRRTEFWIKSQPYSLADMLDHDLVDDFVGGDVFQAFLSPFNYHRWHSPVAGTIRKAYVKEGLYFSEVAPDDSEAYITQLQTRALIFIDCDDPAIGLMCVMPVGMVEISSCVIDHAVKPGAHVEKGQELGYFQFGGSTHCVIFRPGVIKDFTGTQDSLFKVGQAIAHAR